MNKIKVIFTGGTIQSLVSGNNINVNAKTKHMLLSMYGKNLNRFTTTSPVNILSENANVNDVLKMVEAIQDAQNEDICGIILTHGTDTLAYTGAYLSLMIPNVKVPVVLVSSDKVLTDATANGVINFDSAVDFIDDENSKPGIYVAYKNANQNFTSIHLASRMCEPPPYSSHFYSPDGYLYARHENGKIIYENTNVEKTHTVFNMTNKFTKNVLFINPFNGLDYNVFKTNTYGVVLHNLYHSGTANTQKFSGEQFDTNFLNYASFCKKNNIPLYLCNIKKSEVNYDSTNQMVENGVKFLYDILPNVALAKLNIAYNLIDENKIQEFLSQNIAGEILQ